MVGKGSGRTKVKRKLENPLSGIWSGIRRDWGWYAIALAVIGIAFGAKVTIGQEGVSFVPQMWAKKAEAKPIKAPADNAQANSAVLTQQIATLQASTVPLDALPAELRGNGSREDAVRLIKELLSAHNNSFSTIESCIRWLDYGIIGRRIEINPSKVVATQDVEFQGYVRSLQMCMTVLGYYKGANDGKCCNLLNPVIDFQKANGLKPDGIVGARTWNKIRSLLFDALRRKPDAP